MTAPQRSSSACLDDNTASAFAAGTLGTAAVTTAERHLATCRDCRTLVAALAQDDPDDSSAATYRHIKVSMSSIPNGRARASVYGIGDRVGRYVLLAQLGVGGMGVVFAAYDGTLDRKIALKLLRAGSGFTTAEARSRLRREAQAIAQLSHPNVVAAYDIGQTADGDVYIAMEFVEGDTLTSWLKKWPRTWRDILDVFAQAGRGLGAAHAVNLLHRDFKPDNVLVGGDGRVRVSDFGLARSLLFERPSASSSERAEEAARLSALASELTATGAVVGTPRYMPPEQLLGHDIDARGDQFSFCVALFEALYGVHPLPGGTAASMIDRHARAVLPSDSRVPASVGKVVLRGLELEAVKRYPSMTALLAELIPAPVRSRVQLVAYGVGAIALAGAAVAVASLASSPPPPRDDSWELEQLSKNARADTASRAQIRSILEQNAALTGENTRLNAENEQLRKDRADLVAENTALTQQNADLRDKLARTNIVAAHGPPSVAADDVDRTRLDSAIGDAYNNIEACFIEWAGRPPLAGETPHGDGAVYASVDICASGNAHIRGIGGLDSASLTLCVSGAIKRLDFGQTPDDVNAIVTANWTDRALRLRAFPQQRTGASSKCEQD